MITSKDIEKEARILKKYIEKIEEKYNGIEEDGKLRICRKEKQVDFYCVTESGDTKGAYIPKTEISRAQALAQKDYYKRVLKILKRKYHGFLMLDGSCAGDALSSMYDSLHPVRRSLITPVYLPDEEFIRRWSAESAGSKDFDAGDTSCHYTDKRERVRSKSEVMIANRFLMRGIIYQYESALQFKDRVIYPDFRVLNLRTRHTYYFENFGMMDDPDYSAKTVMKINSYILNGYLPGEKLLFTMETQAKPLDMRILDAIIDKYLI